MKGYNWQEFLVTVLAILFGLIIGKFASRGLSMLGVPISAGDPIPVPLEVKQ